MICLPIGNANLSELEEEEFWREVKRWNIAEKSLRRQEPVAFFRLLGFRSERDNYRIKLKHDVAEWGAETGHCPTAKRHPTAFGVSTSYSQLQRHQ